MMMTSCCNVTRRNKKRCIKRFSVVDYDDVVVEDDVNNTIIPHYVVIVGVVLLKLT